LKGSKAAEDAAPTAPVAVAAAPAPAKVSIAAQATAKPTA